MKTTLIIAAIGLAVTSFSPGETRLNSTSRQGVNTEHMIMQIEREPGRELSAINVAENLPQCLMTFITESLPGFTLGVPANFQIEVCCGTPPYRFEITQGTLPAGLHLNQNGKITGKPTEEADTTVFVRLTDSAGCSLTQAFQVQVEPS